VPETSLINFHLDIKQHIYLYAYASKDFLSNLGVYFCLSFLIESQPQKTIWQARQKEVRFLEKPTRLL
jgi:hypothetical protein